MKPEIIQDKLLAIQVCVPKDWTDQQIEDFANETNPPGASFKWTIRREDPIRIACDNKPDYIHVVLLC